VTVRFAIVGAGAIGRLHASVITTAVPGAELVAVVDRTPAKAAELARGYGAEAYPTLAAALDRPDVDAVAVCTPSGVHADSAVAALDAGRHVLIEKPIDVTLAAARRIIAAQRRAGTVAGVVSQHRFDPASQAVYRAVRAGQLGRISSAVVSMAWWRSQEYYDSAGWRGTVALDGGGAVMNQAIHWVDLLVWLLGAPVEVTASTARLAHDGIEVEDTAVATLRFAGGALGVLHATTAAYPGLTARLQVHGDRGSAVIDDDRKRNAFGLLMSLNMLIETQGGFDYTGGDCCAWMPAAGDPRRRDPYPRRGPRPIRGRGYRPAGAAVKR